MTLQTIQPPPDNDKAFEAATLLAETSEVSQEMIYARLCAGWPREFSAITPDPPPRFGRHRVILFGGYIGTVSDWASHLLIPPGTLIARLAAGWTEEDALTKHYELSFSKRWRKADALAKVKAEADKAMADRVARVKPIPMIGRRFGRLVVVEEAGRNPLKWKCECDCGATTCVTGGNLRKGRSQSCGCGRAVKAKTTAELKREERIKELNQHIKVLQAHQEDPENQRLLGNVQEELTRLTKTT